MIINRIKYWNEKIENVRSFCSSNGYMMGLNCCTMWSLNDLIFSWIVTTTEILEETKGSSISLYYFLKYNTCFLFFWLLELNLFCVICWEIGKSVKCLPENMRFSWRQVKALLILKKVSWHQIVQWYIVDVKKITADVNISNAQKEIQFYEKYDNSSAQICCIIYHDSFLRYVTKSWK